MHADFKPGVWRTVLLLGAVLALLVPLSGLGMVRQIISRQQNFTFAQTALVTGAADHDNIATIAPFFAADLAVTGAGTLRAAHKWLFWDQWSRAIGKRGQFGHVPDCSGGGIDIQDPQTVSKGFLRLVGWVNKHAVGQGRIIVITHHDGQIVGYGLVSKNSSDLLDGLLFGPFHREWRGHVRVDAASAREPIVAYLANPSAVKCRIAETKTP